MRRFIQYIVVLLLLISACTPVSRMQVTRLGFEPSEVREQIIYALPQTILKIRIEYEMQVIIPGPYGQYGEKYLGIQNCATRRSENWQILNAGVEAMTEIDPDHYYVINLLEGDPPLQSFHKLVSTGYITGGSLDVNEKFTLPYSVTGNDDYSDLFNDVTVRSYVDQKQVTMYKTIVTDTSFVQVPVNRTILEKKTHEQKAEEAANFILELRLSRFELLSGYGEVFPDGEAMEATLNKMDQLEREYISLFAGKQYTRRFIREFYVLPEANSTGSQFIAGYFSDHLGFVPASLEEGSPVYVEVIPTGKTRSLRNLMPQTPEENTFNQIYYRLPDVADVYVVRDDEKICHQRLNVYQLGALVSEPVDLE